MKLKSSFLIVILFFLFQPIFAQKTVKINGVIIDKQTKELLPFVNIRVAGTLLGSASDYEGKFEFDVDTDYLSNQLYFSAIGYNGLTISIDRYLKNDISTISLEPKSYGLEDVVISTESKVLYKIIFDAKNSIQKNFHHQAIQYQAIYQSEYFENNNSARMRSALVNMTDSDGYGNPKNSFKAINYDFENVIRNFDVENLSDGITILDELLEFDIVRTSNNILSSDFMFEYDLALESEELYNGDSIWLISYQLSNPEVSRSGDFYAELYQGKLFIAKKNYAILKNELQIKSSKKSRQGRSFAVDIANAFTDVTYICTTTYLPHDGSYLLDRISLSKDYINEKGVDCKNIASLRIISSETKHPKMLSQRNYYENLVSDPDFWIVVKNQILTE